MSAIHLRAAWAALLLVALPGAAQAAETCSALAPRAAERPAGTLRPFGSEELVALRDIGPADAEQGADLFALSPDGSRIAYQLVRADAAANRHCIGMFVSDIRPGAAAVQVDEGGELIRTRTIIGRLDAGPSGSARPISPIWAPDGQSFAFLKQVEGVVRIWRAFIDGRPSVPLSPGEDDIERFAFSADGRRLIYSASADMLAARDEIDREGLTGFRYDDRFYPIAGNRPNPAVAGRLRHVSLDIASGAERPASDGEVARLEADQTSLQAAGGRRALLERNEDQSLLPKMRPAIVDPSGKRTVCMASACQGVGQLLGWTRDMRGLLFTRREGWADEQTAVYEWRQGQTTPRRLYATIDALFGCRVANDRLICARETAQTPRHVASIDLKRRTVSVLVDPNPEMAAYSLGRVERWHFRSLSGVAAWTDIVYPVGYWPGARYPAVIIQYSSRGFLRGGTGNEFPIQPFANAGYVVISLQRPSGIALAGGARNAAEAERLLLQDFTDRRNVLSVLDAAIDRLVARGGVDPARVGITGLSDGSSTVQFAALNSKRFAAGAVSGCCWGRSQDFLLGERVSEAFANAGWPRLADHGSAIWDRMSFAQNAHRVAFPMLFQAADREYLTALESFTALRAAQVPADLYVFPDEHHIKWQPAHKLAVFKRNIQWFDFWLRDLKAVDPMGKLQYDDWGAMSSAWRRP